MARELASPDHAPVVGPADHRASVAALGRAAARDAGRRRVSHRAAPSLVSGVVAVTVDAAGTLLLPAEPVASVYARVAARHGATRSSAEIGQRLGAAMREARPLRAGDPTWRAYWSAVILATTGIDSVELVDALVSSYADPSAWRVAPGARTALAELRRRRVRLAVVSNWDASLPRLLDRLALRVAFDAVVVSAACRCEKPSAEIFHEAARRLEVPIVDTVHVGDDAEDDLAGATAAGAMGLDIRAVGGFPGLVAAIDRVGA